MGSFCTTDNPLQLTRLSQLGNQHLLASLTGNVDLEVSERQALEVHNLASGIRGVNQSPAARMRDVMRS